MDYSGSCNVRDINMESVSCWRVYACVAHHSYITLILKSLTPNEILLWASHFSVFPIAENYMFYFVMLTLQVVDYVTSTWLPIGYKIILNVVTFVKYCIKACHPEKNKNVKGSISQRRSQNVIEIISAILWTKQKNKTNYEQDKLCNHGLIVGYPCHILVFWLMIIY